MVKGVVLHLSGSPKFRLNLCNTCTCLRFSQLWGFGIVMALNLSFYNRLLNAKSNCELIVQTFVFDTNV